MPNADLFLIIGVSGVGKTTIGKLLASSLSIPFYDADDFHPKANIEKMSNGIPLSDSDRVPWLQNINLQIQQSSLRNGAVISCSALKEMYRTELSKNVESKIHWISLVGTFDLVQQRMETRSHFMPSSLLQSQFDLWEEPNYGQKLDVGNKPEELVQLILENVSMKKSEIGLIGLGVMGKSLSRNIAGRGFLMSVYNRHIDGSEENVAIDFKNQHEEMSSAKAFDDLKSFVDSLAIPRKIFLMVNAGQAVDHVIQELVPYIDAGDIIIDGGNSHYKDTERRFSKLREHGISYLGTGVSGGEEGALKGPSIMPGGSKEAYEHTSAIWRSIAAKDKNGSGCCAFIGKGGSGHFVKMVHNGIEYAEMQLIAELYGIMRYGMAMSPVDISEVFDSWLQTDCTSYLLEISKDILLKKEDEHYLLDLILDQAGNKGTGSWTTIAACELGVPIPTMTAALYARYQSSYYDLRQEASKVYASANVSLEMEISDLRKAYQIARIINHHQGFNLIEEASKSYDWSIDFKELARIWTNGCIIRSALMEQIAENLEDNSNILLHPKLSVLVLDSFSKLSELVSQVAKTTVAIPCLSSAMNYHKSFIQERSLANMIQAQRDYFGAHTYERLDKERGLMFHTNWK